MKVHEIIAALERWAPPKLAYDWDKPGLSIGDPNADADHVLTALTVTRETFDRARETGAQLIVSHHPLIFQPLKSLRRDNPHARLCLDLAGANIACYAAHTNLDVAPRGVSHILAKTLGLEPVAPLFAGDQGEQVKLITFVPESHLDQVRAAVCDAGAGIIGDYTYCTYSGPGQGTFVPGQGTDPFLGEKRALNIEDERRFETLVLRARLGAVLKAMHAAHPYEEPAYDVIPLVNRDERIGLGVRAVLEEAVPLEAFAQRVAEALDLTHLRYIGDAAKKVRTIGLMGGSGGGSITRVPYDVEVFVTGDVKYHDALDAVTRGLAVIDAGHQGTEKCVVPALAEYLAAHCPGIRVSTYMEVDVFQPILRK